MRAHNNKGQFSKIDVLLHKRVTWLCAVSSVRREIKQEVLGLRELVTYPFGKGKKGER